MSNILPFEGATNRTSVICCQAHGSTSYPVRYPVWLPRVKARIDQDLSFAEVKSTIQVVNCIAVPVIDVKVNSPWLTTTTRALPAVRKAIGKSDYSAQAGATTCGADGVFIVEPVTKIKSKVLVSNLYASGKKQIGQVELRIDDKFLYRVCRGKDIDRWRTTTETYALIVQDPEKRAGLDENLLKLKYEDTYQYLLRFEKVLRGRKSKMLPEEPFYSIYGVDMNTFAPVKVVWGRVANTVAASVLVAAESPYTPNTAIVPFEAMMVVCGSQDEAFYLCACLNSCVANAIVSGSIVLHPDTHVLRRVAVPRFDPESRLHLELSRLAKDCHALADKGDFRTLLRSEARIDALAAKVWRISDDELKAIQEALAESGKSGGRRRKTTKASRDGKRRTSNTTAELTFETHPLVISCTEKPCRPRNSPCRG